jgi:hypothetical protein
MATLSEEMVSVLLRGKPETVSSAVRIVSSRVPQASQ